MRRAWAHPATRWGVLGSFLLAVSSVSPAFLPEDNWWWRFTAWLLPAWAQPDTAVGRAVATALGLVGVALILWSWVRLRPRSGVTGPPAGWVFALWIAPLLLAPEIFSRDAYAYAAEGELIARGANPYEVGPGALGGLWASQTVEVWRWIRAPYQPLALQLHHLVVVAFGHDPYWSATLGMRLLVLVGIGLMAFTLPALARRAGVDVSVARWFALLNPLVVIQLVGGIHNDAVMIGLVFLAAWLAIRPWPVPVRLGLGLLVVSAAMAVKVTSIVAVVPVALLAVPLTVRGPWWRRVWRPGFVVAGATLGALAGFVLISWLCGLGNGWVRALNVPAMVSTIAPSTKIGEGVRMAFNLLGLDGAALQAVRVARALGMVATVAFLCWLFVRTAPWRPMVFWVVGMLAVALGGPALHPWYLAWSATPAVLARPSARVLRWAIWGCLVIVGYSAWNFAWGNARGQLDGPPLAQGLAWACIPGFVVFFRWLDRRHLRGVAHDERLLARGEDHPTNASTSLAGTSAREA